MKILVISQHWAPENGVPQRRWNWLSGILSEKGHQVLAIVPQSPSNRRGKNSGHRVAYESGLNGERIYRVTVRPTTNAHSLVERTLYQIQVAIRSISKVNGIIRNGSEETPELIIGTVPAISTLFVTYVVSKMLRIPYIIDLRDGWPELLDYSKSWNSAVGRVSWRERVLSKGPLQIVKLVVKIFTNSVLKQSKSIIVTTESHRKYLVDKLKKRPSNIVVVRNVFPCESFRSKNRDHRSPGSSLRVLYAGKIGRAQVLENALHAARILQNEQIPISLRFVGSGAALQRLKTVASELEVNAEFFPAVPSNHLGSFYEWADTALINLADWDPLDWAVPSKSYELMENKIYISGSASGESAELINKLSAGKISTPNSPAELAKTWKELVANPSLLEVSDDARNWVGRERLVVAPNNLYKVIESNQYRKVVSDD